MAYVSITPYADRIFGDAYWAERLNATVWTTATTDNRDKALKQATKLIDGLNFTGYRSVDTQAGEFPRNGDTDIPYEVQEACCEIAMECLSGNTLASAVTAKAGIASESIGDASVAYDGVGRAGSMISATLGTLSPVAARLLAPWLRDEDSFLVERVS